MLRKNLQAMQYPKMSGSTSISEANISKVWRGVIFSCLIDSLDDI